MVKRFFVSFGRFKPIDIIIFAGINILCGIYVWKPFIKEFNDKKKLDDTNPAGSSSVSQLPNPSQPSANK